MTGSSRFAWADRARLARALPAVLATLAAVSLVVAFPAAQAPWRALSPPPADNGAPWPAATNTGTAGCPPLRPLDGPHRVTRDGTVLENVASTHAIVVEARNVTLRCVRIRSGDVYPLRLDGAVGTSVDRVEVDCRASPDTNAGIMGSDYTLTRVDVHGCADGIHAGGGVLIQDSYCHDLQTSAPGPHYDCIQVTGCDCGRVEHITVRHNVLRPRARDATSAILVKSDFGPIDDVLVHDNRLDYGAYTVYSRDGGFGPPTGVRFIGNLFGDDHRFGVGSFDGVVRWIGNRTKPPG